MSVQLRVNQNRGIYDNGRRNSLLLRERVLDLSHYGFSQRRIAQELHSSRHFVNNVLNEYNITNSSYPPAKRHKGRTALSPEACVCIEIEKLCKPSIYASELQNRLVLDGIVHPLDIPNRSTIGHYLRSDILMTKKKIHSLPAEANTKAIEDYTDFYLDRISNLDISSLHFFDESSVTKTTTNRRYGNAPIGTPAFEVQRWASNATYTINLMHSCLGVDYVNVIEGPSNGNELLFFFEEAVEISRPNGSVLLERNDTVIMDNCPFHHGIFTELVLRDMLADYGVNLVFQPPYSPHLNTCELCFHQVKAFLNRHQLLADNETQVAIYQACSTISPGNSVGYFRHCGYFI